MTTLPPTPASLRGTTDLAVGLTAGPLTDDPVPHGHRRGRVRRWSYAAAAGDGIALGAAIVSLGMAGSAFAWVLTDDGVHTWDRRLLGRQAILGKLPSDGAAAPALHTPDVRIDAHGGINLHVRTDDGHTLRAVLEATPSTPVVCVTPTERGGWNVTEKEAGQVVRGTVTIDGQERPLIGHGWRDWTVGRQDRHTVWRWAAGAGTAADGRPAGVNVSTGMNAAGPGEDVAWLDGRPIPLEVTRLAPVSENALEGPWVVEGVNWRLSFTAAGVRAADENLLVVSSRYVQPIGHFQGTLPDGEGGTVEVSLMGVTEDHEATW